MNKKKVAPHERFFQLYFRDEAVAAKTQRKAAARKQKEEEVDLEGSHDEADEPADEEAVDDFFDEHIKGMMPKDEGDDDDEHDDPDIDDDDDDDFEGSMSDA